MPQWVYRPSEEEHEKLLKFMETADYPSVSQVLREAVLRLMYDRDREALYTEASELIEDLRETKQKFLSLVLKHSERREDPHEGD